MKFTKDMILALQVLGQVDNKFVACLLPRDQVCDVVKLD